MSVEPFVPPSVDLKDFPFMPIDITRLFGSAFHAKSNDTVWRAGLTLWLKSYHQVPAASLPDEEEELTRLAELGRDVKTWRKIREAALRGWVKCSDGRLYHKVVAEKALEAWIEKVAQRKVSAAGNAKRYKQDFDSVPFDVDLEHARQYLAAINPRSRMLSRKGGKYAIGAPGGTPAGSGDEPEKTLKEREEKEREGKEITQIQTLSAADGGRASDDALRAFFRAFPIEAERDGVRRELARRLGQGVPLAEILEGAKRYATICEGRSEQHIGSPVRWLVDGRWRDGKAKADVSLPIVRQGTPQGDAWEQHLGRKTIWMDGRRTVPSEWPPGPEPESAGAAA